MLSRRSEGMLVLVLLLIGAALRTWNLANTPPGFLPVEIRNIEIIEQIRAGQISVFFGEDGSGGQESSYHTANMLLTGLVGDGLIGFRLLGLWANLLALALLYRTAKALTNVPAALIALALMGSNISALLTSRMVAPLSLVPLFVTATLASIVWAFRLYRPLQPFPTSTIRFTVLGSLLGAALYAHYSAFALALTLLLFMAYLGWTNQPVSRLVWSSSLFALTLFLVLALPYSISLLRTPSHSGFYELWRDRPDDMLALGESLLAMLRAFLFTGDSELATNVPGLPLFYPFWTALLVVGIIAAARRWREPANGLLLITLFVSLLPEFWLRGGPDFQALTIAQPGLFLLAGLGTYTAVEFGRQNRIQGAWVVISALVGISLLWTAWQGYRQTLVNWSARTDVQENYNEVLASTASYLDTHPQAVPMLICTTNLTERPFSSRFTLPSDPELMRMMLHREDVNVRFANCGTAFVLIKGGELMRLMNIESDNLPIPKPELKPWLDLSRRISLGSSALLPNRVFQIQAVGQLSTVLESLQSSSQLLYPLSGNTWQPVSLPVVFGQNMTLLGYRAGIQPTYNIGDVFEISTYWRVDGVPPRHLGIFVRLHDSPRASPYTETNTLNVDPDGLQEGDIIIQTSSLAIPSGLVPGEYMITLGLYENNPLNQLPVFDNEVSQPRGSYLILADRIKIEAQRTEN